MTNRLLIGNLSLETTEDSVEELFSSSGHVQSVVLIKDPQSGKKKGFAFVEMSSKAEAQVAIKELDGEKIDGRSIIVNRLEPVHQSALSFVAKCMRLFQGRCGA